MHILNSKVHEISLRNVLVSIQIDAMSLLLMSHGFIVNSQCAERSNRVTALPLSRVVDFKKSIKLRIISFWSSVKMEREPV